MDSDCSDSDKCIRSHCVQACQVDMCGVNAICNAQGHRAICSCPSRYEGNPHIECTKGMQLFCSICNVECQSRPEADKVHLEPINILCETVDYEPNQRQCNALVKALKSEFKVIYFIIYLGI